MTTPSESGGQRYYTRNRLSRGNGLRKTTGCLTCRRRHVRCDEAKPVCANCERLRQDCTYPSPSARPSTRRRTRSEKSPTAEPSSASSTVCEEQTEGQTDGQAEDPVDNQSQVQPEAPPAIQPPYPVTAPVDGPDDQTWAVDTYSPFAGGHDDLSSSQADITGPTSAPPDWAVAAPTVASGLNVDTATALWAELLLQDAALQDATRFGEAADADIFAKAGAQAQAQQLAVAQSPLQFQHFYTEVWQSGTTLELAPHEHQLFQNFVHNLSRWMDFFAPLRPFGTLIPRLAMRNVGLLNAILALSVRHLSLNRRFQRASEQAQEPVDALPHYFKTLHYIQEAMQHDSYKNSQELLATASIVSAYEMLDGSRRDWERHLQGLFCIQRSQTIHGDSGGLKGAVWWAWLCQDVWAAFREGRRPLTFWRPDRVVGELAPHEMAARAVYLFAQAVAFCSKDDVARGQAAPLRRIAQADALRARLEEWRSHLGLEFEPIPQDTLAHGVFEPIWIHPPSHAVALQMYYCSHILLLLHRPALGGLDVYNAQRRELVSCRNKICGIGMATIDDPSSVMCSQALYIAGMTLENQAQRNLVVDMLDACWQRAGWPLRSLGDELKLRWQSGSE